MNWILVPLVAVPLSISVGQILFKQASGTLRGFDAQSLFALFTNPRFVAALGLYAGATLAWVYVLRAVPVGRAYMFMSLTFVAVPFGAWLVLGEMVGVRQMIGIGIIVAGLLVVSL